MKHISSLGGMSVTHWRTRNSRDVLPCTVIFILVGVPLALSLLYTYNQSKQPVTSPATAAAVDADAGTVLSDGALHHTWLLNFLTIMPVALAGTRKQWQRQLILRMVKPGMVLGSDRVLVGVGRGVL